MSLFPMVSCCKILGNFPKCPQNRVVMTSILALFLRDWWWLVRGCRGEMSCWMDDKGGSERGHERADWRRARQDSGKWTWMLPMELERVGTNSGHLQMSLFIVTWGELCILLYPRRRTAQSSPSSIKSRIRRRMCVWALMPKASDRGHT